MVNRLSIEFKAEEIGGQVKRGQARQLLTAKPSRSGMNLEGRVNPGLLLLFNAISVLFSLSLLQCADYE